MALAKVGQVIGGRAGTGTQVGTLLRFHGWVSGTAAYPGIPTAGVTQQLGQGLVARCQGYIYQLPSVLLPPLTAAPSLGCPPLLL